MKGGREDLSSRSERREGVTNTTTENKASKEMGEGKGEGRKGTRTGGGDGQVMDGKREGVTNTLEEKQGWQGDGCREGRGEEGNRNRRGTRHVKWKVDKL